MSKPDRPPLTKESALEQITAGKTAHEILGVDENASEADINSAFKKLALFVHPDKNKTAEATEAFQKLNKSRDELMARAEERRVVPEKEGRVVVPEVIIAKDRDHEDVMETFRKSLIEKKQTIERDYKISPDKLMDHIEKQIHPKPKSPIFGELNSHQRMVDLLFNALSERTKPELVIERIKSISVPVLVDYVTSTGRELNLDALLETDKEFKAKQAEEQLASLRTAYLSKWQQHQLKTGQSCGKEELDAKNEETKNLRHRHQLRAALEFGILVKKVEAMSEEQFNKLDAWRTEECIDLLAKKVSMPDGSPRVPTCEEMNAQYEKLLARERADKSPSLSPQPTSCFPLFSMIRGIISGRNRN